MLCKRPACSGWTALFAQIHACFNIWLSYAKPVVGVDDALRLDNVGPSGAPKCTTGLLRARDRGLMLQNIKPQYYFTELNKKTKKKKKREKNRTRIIRLFSFLCVRPGSKTIYRCVLFRFMYVRYLLAASFPCCCCTISNSTTRFCSSCCGSSAGRWGGGGGGGGIIGGGGPSKSG